MKTKSVKIKWTWFWVTLLFITPVFPFYLIYCLLTSQRICTRCHNRVKFYLDETDFLGSVKKLI